MNDRKNDEATNEALDQTIEQAEAEQDAAEAAAEAEQDAKAAKASEADETDGTAAEAESDGETESADAKSDDAAVNVDIVYDDEEDDGAAAGDDEHRPALDQTDALIASFLGTDANAVKTAAKPASAQQPAEAAPVMVASKIDREITDNDSTVFSTYPALAFKQVVPATRRGAAAPFDDPLDLAFYSRRVYAVSVHSDEQRIALLELLAGLARPSSGRIMFKSKNMDEITGAEYRGHFAGLVLQRNALRTDLTALDNITNAMEASGRNFLKPKPIIAEELLNEVGLPAELHSTAVSALPEIHRRRVAIARALCCEPALLIADAPVAGIEDPTRSELLGLFKKIARKDDKAVIIVTSGDDLSGFVDKTITL